VAFQLVTSRAAIPEDRGLGAEVDGVQLALFRVGDEVHAIESACPHAGVPLEGGCIEAGVVTCPAHGFRYDVRTGFDPEYADGFPIPCFAVRLEGDEVFVDIEQRTNDPRKR